MVCSHQPTNQGPYLLVPDNQMTMMDLLLSHRVVCTSRMSYRLTSATAWHCGALLDQEVVVSTDSSLRLQMESIRIRSTAYHRGSERSLERQVQMQMQMQMQTSVLIRA